MCALMYLALSVSYALVLALTVPAAGFLVRVFVIFHDCSHGSLLPSKRANRWVGAVLGVLVFEPFSRWKHEHAVHHATSGDLDRRGTGDVRTLTVSEYDALAWRARAAYRLLRNPVVMFGFGPLVVTVLGPRFVARGARRRMRRSVLGTDVALAAAVGGMCWAVGWRPFVLVQFPCLLLAGSVGIWMFYVQHQFEGAYWENAGSWRYADAALRGSSYLRLPPVLRFFTANIGFHHVHHLNARIPNYNLRRAHEQNQVLQQVPTLSVRDGVRAVRLKLWDERDGRLVTFAQARALTAARAGSQGSSFAFLTADVGGAPPPPPAG